MKELDILLGSFLEGNHEALAKGAWPEFEDFLELEDDLMWDYLRLDESSSPTSFKVLITAIRGSQDNHA